MRCNRLTAMLLCASAASLPAQNTQTPNTEPGSGALRIAVIDGQGAINNIAQRTLRAPVVRVENREGRPVADALVTFTLPSTGPGATFGGAQSRTIRTGSDGLAEARGLEPNSTPGPFEIRVIATSQGDVARAVITQTNAAPAPLESAGSRKKWYVIAAAVAGGVAAGVLVSRTGTANSQPNIPGGSTGPTPGPPTIFPGTPVIGPPR